MLAIAAAVWKSRTGAVVIAFLAVAAALYTWHRLDKSSAVRSAVTSYVADVELAAAEAELAAARKRAEAAEAANFSFQRQLSEAEAIATIQAQELSNYESTSRDVVDQRLLGRLPNR